MLSCPTENSGVIRFVRISQIDPQQILDHLSDPRIARHLPLLPENPNLALVERMVAEKEACWQRDGLGHWAILWQHRYAGWGGFERVGDDWDFGLVLRPEHRGRGKDIALQALAWARENTVIDEVTFLLPMSRSVRALASFGAISLGIVEHAGLPFRKWRLSLRTDPDRSPAGQHLHNLLNSVDRHED